ncbi:MAG: DEAD/DEAH box helicase family protein [Methyloglobulus sp.]|nr:DEAD/DEAH box helicase family protein [Methyloglobulus sp.]
MAVTYRNDDFVLQIQDDDAAVRNIFNKYDAFLAELSGTHYSFQTEAIKTVLKFLLSSKYKTTGELAAENFDRNTKLQSYFGETLQNYLSSFALADKKSVSVDLATGTGKSFAIYGLARLLLAEGLVDKVLVLCPTLTIEDGLKSKFFQLSADPNLTSILQELGAVYLNPGVKSANDPILAGDICVENIHAVYDRTGSSIRDSFTGKGNRTLVLNDEAHHIFSGVDQATKRWLEFLQNPEFGFHFIVNFTGTPYIGDSYFPDVVYRYSLKKAIEAKVVKQVDYALERLIGVDCSYEETYQNHLLNRNAYVGKLKPISIVVTEKIASCVEVWNELVEFIVDKEKLSRQEAEKKVIWVASGIPSGNDGERVKAIVDKPDKVRRDNVQLLKTVDDPQNPVEWIVSVSMLTEGWDVKNVFQIVPHENKAFNSKLLISQVLGRGLRMPSGLSGSVMVKINNHERWTQQIADLYRDVLEIENRLSWGYLEAQKKYVFDLYNLDYQVIQQTEEVKLKTASEPEVIDYSPQSRSYEEITTYNRSGKVATLIENRNIFTIDEAVKRIKLFLKDKDEELSLRWTSIRIANLIQDNLRRTNQETDFISHENLFKTQQAFGPLFRDLGKTSPRFEMKPNNLIYADLSKLNRQSFSEDGLKNDTHVFYSENQDAGLLDDEKSLWKEFMKIRGIAVSQDYYRDEDKHLLSNLHPISLTDFKSPTNFIVTSSKPETKFVEHIFQNIGLFDSFLKSPDKGFYAFPYSYKPETTAKTHVKSENFNPDFFIKVFGKQEVLVIEIKADGDDSNKNKAKLREGIKHYEELNRKLEEVGWHWTYHFYFLSPEDYPHFFIAVKDGRYENWESSLMNNLKPGLPD